MEKTLNTFDLTCLACGQVLASDIEFLATDATISSAANKEAVPKGKAFLYDPPYGQDSREPIRYQGVAPKTMMSGTDLDACVSWAGVINGCCGPDGCDGPNRQCQCGAMIGTETRDCWTAFMFLPDVRQTKWVRHD